jgi:ankyrin repeat protein
MQCGFDVNDVRIPDGKTPLMLAAQRGDAKVLRVLLAADPPANINQQDHDGMTALVYAAESNRAMAVKMLLDAGANPRLTDGRGHSPLHYCRSAESVALIVDAAPDLVNQSSNDGTKPVAHITDLPALKELFRSSVRHNIQVDVNHRDDMRSTALHSRMFKMSKLGVPLWEPMAGAIPQVKLLLEHGADVFAVDCDGATVLMEPLRYDDPHGLYYCEAISALSQTKDVDAMIATALKMIMDQILSLCSATESVPVLASTSALAPTLALGR